MDVNSNLWTIIFTFPITFGYMIYFFILLYPGRATLTFSVLLLLIPVYIWLFAAEPIVSVVSGLGTGILTYPSSGTENQLFYFSKKESMFIVVVLITAVLYCIKVLVMPERFLVEVKQSITLYVTLTSLLGFLFIFVPDLINKIIPPEIPQDSLEKIRNQANEISKKYERRLNLSILPYLIGSLLSSFFLEVRFKRINVRNKKRKL